MENDKFKEFNHNGWTILRGMISTEEIELLKKKIEAIDSNYDNTVGTDKLKKRTGLLMNSRQAASIVTNLIRKEEVSRLLNYLDKPAIEHTKVLIKAKLAPETPWHQDSGFWQDIDPQNSMFTIWIPLANVDEKDGCLRILDTGLDIEHVNCAHKPAHGDMEREMEKEVIQELLSKYPVINCSLNAGDALVFKSWVIHSAFPNKTDKERMAFKVVFQDLAKRPLPLSIRGVRLTGFTGLLNLTNACMITRFKIQISNLVSTVKSFINHLS